MAPADPPPPPDPSDEARLAYATLVAYSRASTAWCRRGSFEECDGVLCFAGGSWVPVNCNGVLRTYDAVPAPEVLARADEFFAGRRRGYTVKIRDTGQDADLEAAATALGLVAFGESFPEMICRAPLAPLEPPAGIDMHLVVDEAGVADFAAVNADAYAVYGMPADVLPDSFDQPDRVLADDGVALMVASRGTVPLAAALTYASDGIASLQWVGTVGAARRLGLGRCVTQAVTNLAFDRGAAAVTLQASEMGEPIYAALGYEILYRYQNLVRWEVPTA